MIKVAKKVNNDKLFETEGVLDLVEEAEVAADKSLPADLARQP
jgi:hypothetical protein